MDMQQLTCLNFTVNIFILCTYILPPPSQLEFLPKTPFFSPQSTKNLINANTLAAQIDGELQNLQVL
jgi:hypothetical protein